MDISCVIVSCNNANQLQDAMASVLGQTLRPRQILVSDDASTDGSWDVIRTFSRNHREVLSHRNEDRLGVSANRDLAIRRVRSSHFTTLDGDDFYRPRKLEAEAVAIARDQAEIAFSDIELVEGAARRVRVLSLEGFPRDNHYRRVRYLTSRRGYIPRDMLLPLEAYMAVGGLRHDFDLYEDWEFKLRLGATGLRWAYSETVGTVYNRLGSGASMAPTKEHLRARLKALRLNRNAIIASAGTHTYVTAMVRLIVWAGLSQARRSRVTSLRHHPSRDE